MEGEQEPGAGWDGAGRPESQAQTQPPIQTSCSPVSSVSLGCPERQTRDKDCKIFIGENTKRMWRVGWCGLCLLRKEEGRKGARQDESSTVRSFQEGFRPKAEGCSRPALVGSGTSCC